MNKPIYLAVSPWFIFCVSIFYVSTAVAITLAAWPLWLKIIFICFLIADYKRVIYQHGIRTHKYAVSILNLDCNKWHYELSSGRNYKGTLIRKRSFCNSLVIVFYMLHMHGGRYIIIPRDAISKHNFRFLAYKLYSCTT